MGPTIANAQPDPSTRDTAAREAAASRYDRCHPDDSFADLARRARFSKEDRRLMEDWLDAAARQAGEDGRRR